MKLFPVLVAALASARKVAGRGAVAARGTGRGGKSRSVPVSDPPSRQASPSQSPSPDSPVVPPSLITPGPSSSGDQDKAPVDPAITSSPAPSSPSPVSPELSSDSEPEMSTFTPASHVAVQSQGHRHPPIIYFHRLTITELNMVLDYLATYFSYKKITEDSERKLILTQCFTHPDSIDFFMAHRRDHAALTYDALVVAIRSEVVGPRWDRDVYDAIPKLGMLTSEAGGFGALWNKAKLMNVALEDTNYHRSDDEMQRLVHGRMLPSFIYYCLEKGTDDRTPFEKWKLELASLSESFPAWYQPMLLDEEIRYAICPGPCIFQMGNFLCQAKYPSGICSPLSSS
ncbi:hypothetical protein V5O48_017396 [Marasmius crinis-equi]|uniref:Uncharacterized protein n=1 Tax=Marasmius crinis-equi TaxID=585013 RepID=A0ABR3EP12_9AGAR